MKNRKSIFEIERRINLRDAYKSVIDDLRETIVNPHAYCGETLFHRLDVSIKTWPYRNASNSIDMYARYHGFSLYGSNDEDMIYSFELIANLLCWVMKNESESGSRRVVLGVKYGTVAECQRCYENIKYLVEQLNMNIREKCIEGMFPQYLICKRDVDVDVVLESVPELSEILLTYLDIRNQNDIEVKRIILKQIADFLEPIRIERVFKGTSYKTLCEDLFYIFNNYNIRHNNEQQIKLTDLDQMELYDKAFKASVHLLQKGFIDEFLQLVKDLKTDD